MNNIPPDEARRLINTFEMVGEQIQVERDKYECKLDCQRRELHSLREGLTALESINKELRAKVEELGQENERLLAENLIYQPKSQKVELKENEGMAADGFMLDAVVVDGKLVDYRTFDVGMITEQYAGIEGVGVATVRRMADIMFFTQADEYQKDFANFYWMAWECEAFSRLLHSNFKVVYDDLSPVKEEWDGDRQYK